MKSSLKKLKMLYAFIYQTNIWRDFLNMKTLVRIIVLFIAQCHDRVEAGGLDSGI